MMEYFKNKRRTKILTKVSELTNIDIKKIKILFSNITFERYIKVQKLDSLNEMRENLWQNNIYKVTNHDNLNYSNISETMTYSCIYYGKEEVITVLKGKVKPGTIDIINGICEMSRTIEPIIEKETLTIFMKTIIYVGESPFRNCVSQVIYVYVP